jgi:hypothetical protein
MDTRDVSSAIWRIFAVACALLTGSDLSGKLLLGTRMRRLQKQVGYYRLQVVLRKLGKRLA